MKVRWSGKDEKKLEFDEKTDKTVVRVDPKYFRPTESRSAYRDPAKARKRLGWKATVTFEKAC